MTHPHLTAEQVKNWKNLKGNFTFTPNYIDLVTGIWNTLAWYYVPDMWHNYSFTDEFTRHFFFPLKEVYYIVYIAVSITLVRFLFERFIGKPFANWVELKAANTQKFPESAWKFTFYTCTWFFNVYLLNYRYDYFQQPYLIWDDWSSGMDVPFDIKLMYFVQCGFYLHSIYATIYMDSKRKDFYAMLIHHVVTMTLIFVSYATRYHKIGLLVLFVHDITDVWLELGKLLHYMSERKENVECPQWEVAANGCFGMFIICWFIFRLYWYPLKVLYSTGVVTPHRAYGRGCGLYGFFNSLLWMLLGLNMYWLFFILQILFRILQGSSKGLKDTREDEDDEISPTPEKTPVNNIPEEKKKKK